MRACLVTGLCLSVLGSGAQARAQHDAAERAAWNQEVEPFRIVGNVYYVGVAGVAAYLVHTPAGELLLDGGLPESAPCIAASIAALGFRLADVKILLNSHAHFDHAGGLAELKRRSGAKLVASRPDAGALQKGTQESLGSGGAATFPAVAVDRLIDDGATVRLGDAVLTAHLTPGHTRGCTTWTLPIRDGKETHQVVFYCSTSTPGYRLVNNPTYPQIAADYARSFALLRRLSGDVFLAPHGSFFDLDGKRARLASGAHPNPFVDPTELRRFVDASERDFNAELARQTSASR